MKIEQMEYLVHFAHSGSVGATAMHFYMTKQGMNKSLHQLERDSDYILFEKGASGLTLTGAGVEFAKDAELIVQAYHDLRRGMYIYSEKESVLPEAPVLVLATSAAMRYLVPQLGLQKPGVFPFEVLLREMNQREIVETMSLRRNEKIMGLATIPSTEKYVQALEDATANSGLIFDMLGESDVYALVSTSSKLAQLELFDIQKDLDGQKVGYVYDEMLRDALDDYVRDEDVRTVTSNVDLLDEQIATNRLITFAPSPRLINKKPPSGITAVPCGNGVKIRYGMIHTDRNQDDPDILQVVTKIRTAMSMPGTM